MNLSDKNQTFMVLSVQTQSSESRKPAFRWIGLSMKSMPAEVIPADKHCKRAFGTDMTNKELKKCRFESLPLEGKQKKTAAVVKKKSEDLKECNLTARRQLLGRSTGYAFGPFCPNNQRSMASQEDDEVKTDLDWEAMAASFNPRYHNQGKQKPQFNNMIKLIMYNFIYT